MSTLRQRRKKDVLEIAKEFDAFRTLPEDYTKRSEIGGTLSLISRLLIIFLIYKEISYYRHSDLIFKFKPDLDLDSKLDLFVDLTVATPCQGISGLDIVDSTMSLTSPSSSVKQDDTWWELSQDQRDYFEGIQHMNSFLREEYHSIAQLVFKNILFSSGGNYKNNMPERKDKPQRPHDACRLHGSLTVNKMAGVLHIVPGTTLHSHFGHIHITEMRGKLNFTHRINRFSFGDLSSRMVHPLEGDERYIYEESSMIQYFIQVVPTEIHGFLSKVNTFQYSVKENIRPIDHNKGSHGMPGIYFKFDMSALKVIVQPDRDNIIQFIIRLCSIIAGIVVISGILNSILQIVYEFFMWLVIRKIFNKNSQITISTIELPTPPPTHQKPIEKSTIPVPIVIPNKNDLIQNVS